MTQPLLPVPLLIILSWPLAMAWEVWPDADFCYQARLGTDYLLVRSTDDTGTVMESMVLTQEQMEKPARFDRKARAYFDLGRRLGVVL